MGTCLILSVVPSVCPSQKVKPLESHLSSDWSFHFDGGASYVPVSSWVYRCVYTCLTSTCVNFITNDPSLCLQLSHLLKQAQLLVDEFRDRYGCEIGSEIVSIITGLGYPHCNLSVLSNKQSITCAQKQTDITLT